MVTLDELSPDQSVSLSVLWIHVTRMKYGDLDNEISGRGEKEGWREKYFSEGMRQIPRMRDHLTQPNQLDGSLSALRPKKETEKTEQSPSHHESQP